MIEPEVSIVVGGLTQEVLEDMLLAPLRARGVSIRLWPLYEGLNGSFHMIRVGAADANRTVVRAKHLADDGKVRRL